MRVRREVAFNRDPLVRYDVVAALLNLTGPAGEEVWVMAPEGFEGLGTQVRMRVRALREVSARDIHAGVRGGTISPALLAFASVAFASVAFDELRRQDLGGLAKVFAELAERTEEWKHVLKFQFYDEYGVEEYYVYDPNTNRLLVYVRGQATLRMIRFRGEFVSPRLGVRFDVTGPEMRVFYPDGRPFLSFEELEEARFRAEQRANSEQQRAEEAERRAARLASLSRKARRGQASPEELRELEQLEQEIAPNGSA